MIKPTINTSQSELKTCLEIFQELLKTRTGNQLYMEEPELYNTISQTINILEYRLQDLLTTY